MEHDNETPLAYESCHQFLNEEQHQQEPVHNDNMDNYMITEEQRMHFEQMDAETLASSQPVSGVLGGARQVDTWSLSSSQQDSRANDSTKRCREAYKREVPRLFNIIQKNRNTLQQLNRDLHGICQHYLGLLSLPRDTDVLAFPQFDQVNRERLAALEDLETNFQGFKLEKKGKWSKGYQVNLENLVELQKKAIQALERVIKAVSTTDEETLAVQTAYLNHDPEQRFEVIMVDSD